MSERSIYCYSWDLSQEGVQRAVDGLQARHINTFSMATSYHAGKFVRAHHAGGKVIFPEDGTIYFRSDAERYGVLKPEPNSLLASQDVLGELCAIDGIKVNAWIVVLHNSRLGLKHPDATVRNAFGDRYIYNLCPANPDSRHYAVALCADVAASYPVNRLCLETPGYMPYSHGYHHEFSLIRHNIWLDRMLGLCFCDHCKAGAQKAGIDAERLQKTVVRSVDDYLASDLDYPDDMAAAFWLADVLDDPDLGAFLRWRCDVVTSLVAEIQAALPGHVKLTIIPSVARPSGGCWYEGSNMRDLAAAADSLEICFYEPEVSRIRCDLMDVRRRAGEGAGIRAILRPGHPDLKSREAVASAVSTLSASGIHDFAFYNYGHLRKASLDWMGEALGALK